ncbi:MAG TPA: N-acetylmuramoyl-L-alanine amidase [Gemmatimonadaceae bacterium]|nr:N-acetylmuramoyl-L-alanine amidase [Gemmatimonadaceae bacterium]
MMFTLVIVAALQAGTLPVQSVAQSGARPRNTTTAPRRARVPAPRADRLPPTTALARVVVDAGHGGVDGGAGMKLGDRLREKDITLQVALKLGQVLRQRGVDVVYTRTTDTLIALADRGKIANQANGDVFISIHVNAANPNWRDPSAARGFETYFLAEAKTEDAQRVEAMENESVRFETASNVAPDDPLNFILSDMQQNEHLRESADLAEIVQRHLAPVHPGPSRGVKQAGFRVLVTAFMPAVLVELGFGTNAAEAEFLSSPSKQKQLANAIADGTMEYLGRYQRRIGGGAASTGHD